MIKKKALLLVHTQPLNREPPFILFVNHFSRCVHYFGASISLVSSAGLTSSTTSSPGIVRFNDTAVSTKI